jgi:mRNA-degrading endonuclease RelE of RelBE toxin-antitoxin system
MNQDEKKSIDEIVEIFKKYTDEINDLKKEQDKIFSDFIEELEKEKMEEIRNKIKGE